MSYIQLTNAQTSSQRHTPTMTSHNPGRSQLVAVPSSNILERASASERVFWSSISDAVQSNTEDRSEIRTLIRHIRESFAKIGEDGHPTEEVQRAHDIVVDDLRSTIVELLSSSYKSSSVVPTPRSSSNHELTTEHKHHSSRPRHVCEAVLQGARDIIGQRRVQLERELHELSTRQAQLLHCQEHGYRDASRRSGSIVVPGFPGPKGRQEYPGAKSFDGPLGIAGDQVIQGPDRVPGNLVPTGDDGLQGVRGDVEPKGFPEPTGRDGKKGIPEEQGNTRPQRFPDGEGCRGLDGADKVPDSEFLRTDAPPGFYGQQGDTGFSKGHGPPGFDRRQGDTRFSESDGPPGFDRLQRDPGLLGIPGSQGCTRVQGRSDFQGDTGEQAFPGPDAATGDTRRPGVPVVKESDGEDCRLGCTCEASDIGKNECPGPQGPAGEQGFPGPDAATGDTGRLGVPVVRESDGEDGRPGRTGEAGVTGEKGNPGPQGPAGSSGDKDFELLEGGPGINEIAKDSIVRVTRPIEFRGVPGEQGFRGNPGTVGSDGAPGVPGRRGLSGDVCRTGPPGLIGLDGDLGSTVFRGSKVFDGSIGCQGSPGAIGTRGRQESEFPTRRICLPDRVVDEGKPGLCVVPEGSGLVGPCGLNSWPDECGQNGPNRTQRFPGQKCVCGITSCVGLRGMAGRQCDTGARALLGANGLRSLIGLPEPTGYVYALKRWRQVQFDPGIFRSRWRSDYLLTLEPQWQLKY